MLARNGRPILGDLHYLAATRLADFQTPMAQAEIGAALAMLGDRARATEVFKAAETRAGDDKDGRDYRFDYGSRLRDAAGVLTLEAEAGVVDDLGGAGRLLQAAQRSPYPTSTQEQAWLVLAAQAIESRAKGLRLSVDGENREGALYRTFTARRLANRSVAVVNTGAAALDAVVTASGQVTSTEPAASQGYTIERRYYRPDGTRTMPSSVRQNERLLVVLKITEDESKTARLLLTDPLPAGFEIDNPDLVASGTVPKLPDDVTDEVKPVHTEFRDDGFAAAFDRTTDQPAFFTVAYMVRAVTPGRFVHPPATVEDMYRPERFGRTAAGSVEISPAP